MGAEWQDLQSPQGRGNTCAQSGSCGAADPHQPGRDSRSGSRREQSAPGSKSKYTSVMTLLLLTFPLSQRPDVVSLALLLALLCARVHSMPVKRKSGRGSRRRPTARYAGFRIRIFCIEVLFQQCRMNMQEELVYLTKHGTAYCYECTGKDTIADQWDNSFA